MCRPVSIDGKREKRECRKSLEAKKMTRMKRKRSDVRRSVKLIPEVEADSGSQLSLLTSAKRRHSKRFKKKEEEAVRRRCEKKSSQHRRKTHLTCTLEK